MILQLGVILGAAGSAILQTGISTLFPSGPEPRGLTTREVGRIVRADQRLTLLGERAVIGEDPFTGGTLLLRESQTLLPGLVEQLALEAAVRREETRLGLREIPTPRQLSAGEFPFPGTAAARALSGSPRVVASLPPGGPPPEFRREIPRPPVTGPVGVPEPPMIPRGGGPILAPGCFPGTLAGRRACQPLRSAFV